MDDEEARRAHGIDETAGDALDVGEESNPDLGTVPGQGVDELSDDERVWRSVERVERGDGDTD